jgi:hypothetical protein
VAISLLAQKQARVAWHAPMLPDRLTSLQDAVRCRNAASAGQLPQDGGSSNESFPYRRNRSDGRSTMRNGGFRRYPTEDQGRCKAAGVAAYRHPAYLDPGGVQSGNRPTVRLA